MLWPSFAIAWIAAIAYTCHGVHFEINLANKPGLNGTVQIKLICRPTGQNSHPNEEQNVLWEGSQFGSADRLALASSGQLLVPDIRVNSSERYRCLLISPLMGQGQHRALRKRVLRQLQASVPAEFGSCSPGYRLDQERCFPCFPGSYTSGQESECYLCPVDFYMSHEAADSCHPCPDGKKTLAEGADSENLCIFTDEAGQPVSAVPTNWLLIGLGILLFIATWIIIGILLMRYCKKKKKVEAHKKDSKVKEDSYFQQFTSAISDTVSGSAYERSSDARSHIHSKVKRPSSRYESLKRTSDAYGTTKTSSSLYDQSSRQSSNVYGETLKQPSSAYEVVKQSSSAYEVLKQPSSAYEVVKQPSSAYEVLTQPSSAYDVLKQPSSAYEVLKQPSSAYEVVKQPSSAYEVLTQTSSAYDVVKQPSSAYEVVKQPSSTYEAIKQPSGSYELVKQQSSAYEVVKQPSSVYEVLKQPSSTYEAIKQPSGSYELVKQPSSASEVVKQPSGSYELVKQPSSASEVVKQPSGSYELVKQPSGASEVVKQPSTAYEIVKQPSGAYEFVKQPSSAYEIVKQPSGAYEAIKQPSGAYELFKHSSSAYEDAKQSSSAYEVVKEPSRIYETVEQPDNVYEIVKQPSIYEVIKEPSSIYGQSIAKQEDYEAERSRESRTHPSERKSSISQRSKDGSHDSRYEVVKEPSSIYGQSIAKQEDYEAERSRESRTRPSERKSSISQRSKDGSHDSRYEVVKEPSSIYGQSIAKQEDYEAERSRESRTRPSERKSSISQRSKDGSHDSRYEVVKEPSSIYGQSIAKQEDYEAERSHESRTRPSERKSSISQRSKDGSHDSHYEVVKEPSSIYGQSIAKQEDYEAEKSRESRTRPSERKSSISQRSKDGSHDSRYEVVKEPSSIYGQSIAKQEDYEAERSREFRTRPSERKSSISQSSKDGSHDDDEGPIHRDDLDSGKLPQVLPKSESTGFVADSYDSPTQVSGKDSKVLLKSTSMPAPKMEPGSRFEEISMSCPELDHDVRKLTIVVDEAYKDETVPIECECAEAWFHRDENKSLCSIIFSDPDYVPFKSKTKQTLDSVKLIPEEEWDEYLVDDDIEISGLTPSDSEFEEQSKTGVEYGAKSKSRTEEGSKSRYAWVRESLLSNLISQSKTRSQAESYYPESKVSSSTTKGGLILKLGSKDQSLSSEKEMPKYARVSVLSDPSSQSMTRSERKSYYPESKVSSSTTKDRFIVKLGSKDQSLSSEKEMPKYARVSVLSDPSSQSMTRSDRESYYPESKTSSSITKDGFIAKLGSKDQSLSSEKEIPKYARVSVLSDPSSQSMRRSDRQSYYPESKVSSSTTKDGLKYARASVLSDPSSQSMTRSDRESYYPESKTSSSITKDGFIAKLGSKDQSLSSEKEMPKYARVSVLSDPSSQSMTRSDRDSYYPESKTLSSITKDGFIAKLGSKDQSLSSEKEIPKYARVSVLSDPSSQSMRRSDRQSYYPESKVSSSTTKDGFIVKLGSKDQSLSSEKEMPKYARGSVFSDPSSQSMTRSDRESYYPESKTSSSITKDGFIVKLGSKDQSLSSEKEIPKYARVSVLSDPSSQSMTRSDRQSYYPESKTSSSITKDGFIAKLGSKDQSLSSEKEMPKYSRASVLSDPSSQSVTRSDKQSYYPESKSSSSTTKDGFIVKLGSKDQSLSSEKEMPKYSRASVLSDPSSQSVTRSDRQSYYTESKSSSSTTKDGFIVKLGSKDQSLSSEKEMPKYSRASVLSDPSSQSMTRSERESYYPESKTSSSTTKDGFIVKLGSKYHSLSSEKEMPTYSHASVLSDPSSQSMRRSDRQSFYPDSKVSSSKDGSIVKLGSKDQSLSSQKEMPKYARVSVLSEPSSQSMTRSDRESYYPESKSSSSTTKDGFIIKLGSKDQSLSSEKEVPKYARVSVLSDPSSQSMTRSDRQSYYPDSKSSSSTSKGGLVVKLGSASQSVSPEPLTAPKFFSGNLISEPKSRTSKESYDPESTASSSTTEGGFVVKLGSKDQSLSSLKESPKITIISKSGSKMFIAARDAPIPPRKGYRSDEVVLRDRSAIDTTPKYRRFASMGNATPGIKNSRERLHSFKAPDIDHEEDIVIKPSLSQALGLDSRQSSKISADRDSHQEFSGERQSIIVRSVPRFEPTANKIISGIAKSPDTSKSHSQEDIGFSFSVDSLQSEPIKMDDEFDTTVPRSSADAKSRSSHQYKSEITEKERTSDTKEALGPARPVSSRSKSISHSSSGLNSEPIEFAPTYSTSYSQTEANSDRISDPISRSKFSASETGQGKSLSHKSSKSTSVEFEPIYAEVMDQGVSFDGVPVLEATIPESEYEYQESPIDSASSHSRHGSTNDAARRGSKSESFIVKEGSHSVHPVDVYNRASSSESSVAGKSGSIKLSSSSQNPSAEKFRHMSSLEKINESNANRASMSKQVEDSHGSDQKSTSQVDSQIQDRPSKSEESSNRRSSSTSEGKRSSSRGGSQVPYRSSQTETSNVRSGSSDEGKGSISRTDSQIPDRSSQLRQSSYRQSSSANEDKKSISRAHSQIPDRYSQSKESSNQRLSSMNEDDQLHSESKDSISSSRHTMDAINDQNGSQEVKVISSLRTKSNSRTNSSNSSSDSDNDQKVSQTEQTERIPSHSSRTSVTPPPLPPPLRKSQS